MCGRYYVDDGVEDALERIAGYREAVQAGDIVPSAAAPVMAAGGKDGRLTAGPMRWGYPVSFAGADDRTAGKLLINARAETVLTKRSFEKDVLYRRCIIPAAGFYEWNRSREKVTFTAENGGVLFMAGIYRLDRDGKHFVIITTAANAADFKRAAAAGLGGGHRCRPADAAHGAAAADAPAGIRAAALRFSAVKKPESPLQAVPVNLI